MPREAEESPLAKESQPQFKILENSSIAQLPDIKDKT